MVKAAYYKKMESINLSCVTVYDKVRSHMIKITEQTDVSSCNYHLFRVLKEAMRREKLQEFVRNWLLIRRITFCNTSSKKLMIKMFRRN